jgi:uncharacterized protein (UPF0335 family)
MSLREEYRLRIFVERVFRLWNEKEEVTEERRKRHKEWL